MNSKKKWNEIRNESKPKKNEILKLNENDFYLKVFFSKLSNKMNLLKSFESFISSEFDV